MNGPGRDDHSIIAATGQTGAKTAHPVKQLKNKYFEDYQIGETVACGSHQVTEEEIIDFAEKWDPLPIHIDKEAAATSPFGGIVASGCHVLAIALRLTNRSDATPAVLGAIGWDEIRFMKPVRPGDRLSLELECLEVRSSNSKPDRGIIRQLFTLKNQDDRTVFQFKDCILVGRKT